MPPRRMKTRKEPNDAPRCPPPRAAASMLREKEELLDGNEKLARMIAEEKETAHKYRARLTEQRCSLAIYDTAATVSCRRCATMDADLEHLLLTVRSLVISFDEHVRLRSDCPSYQQMLIDTISPVAKMNPQLNDMVAKLMARLRIKEAAKWHPTVLY